MAIDLDIEICENCDEETSYRVVFDQAAKGAFGEIKPVVQDGRIIYDVSCGDPEKVSFESMRDLGAILVRAGEGKDVMVVDALALHVLNDKSPGYRSAIFEGAYLAAYKFEKYKSESKKVSKKPLEKLIVKLAPGGATKFEPALRRAKAVIEGVYLARDLVNEPPSKMTPTAFAEVARTVAEANGLEIRVWNEDDAKRERLGGLLGVAQGSVEPPRLIRLHYTPATTSGETKRVALVGKGITFDSGGLSIKSASGMMTMKTDMSGAAAVLSAMASLASLGSPFEVYGYMALTENMPSGSAQKPGDILTTRLGKTIEVLNTDAEGRLVLADALTLAVEDGAEEILDIATLTGACVVALGVEIAGILGNNDELVGRVIRAGADAGESLWHLPLPEKYKKHIESEVADMKNIGAVGQAGTLSAGLLLKEFIGDVPWVHLDIAGPARSDVDSGCFSKGGTGFGVRTICEWLTEGSWA